MDIEYIHFYGEDAIAFAQSLQEHWGFHRVGGWVDSTTCHEQLMSGDVRFLISSPLSSQDCLGDQALSPVAQYLECHPAGVADVALRVPDLVAVLQRAKRLGARLWAKDLSGTVPWAVISGWGDLRHTLIQGRSPAQHSPGDRPSASPPLPLFPAPHYDWPDPPLSGPFERIDHLVLNVEAGDLAPALHWYQQLLDLEPRQAFHIQTAHSGLRSQVLVGQPSAPGKTDRFQLPINEPASSQSQIQEFLDHNRGPGIQHIALLTSGLLGTVERLRKTGISFLSVPPAYYEQLSRRPGFERQDLAVDWPQISAQQVLVDWQQDWPMERPIDRPIDRPINRQEGPLLQIFTQPIFPEPTFFFELIERRSLKHHHCPAQGFGEGNFRALFEAIEREQRSRLAL